MLFVIVFIIVQIKATRFELPFKLSDIYYHVLVSYYKFVKLIQLKFHFVLFQVIPHLLSIAHSESPDCINLWKI